jgi:glycosyltransferase involved in cell wall biosynthesis
MRQPYRVLLDLSYTPFGYCGIAQESRSLLKSLFQLDALQLTGLVYSQKTVKSHRFSSDGRGARNLESQALFLQSLADGPAPFQGRARLWWQYLKDLCRACTRRVQTLHLDRDLYWDVIWRHLLVQSLSDEDIVLAQNCAMLLANLSGPMLRLTSLLRLPALRLDTAGFDFALFHNPQPIRVNRGTVKLIRFYDLIPGLRPDLVAGDRAVKAHFRDLRRCLHDSLFVCISEPARADLVRAFPEAEDRSVTIPVVLSDTYHREMDAPMLPLILGRRQSDRLAKHPPAALRAFSKERAPPYLIMTATLEPRKNYVMLAGAFVRLLARHDTDLRMIIVANAGWKYQDSARALAPLIQQGQVIHLENVPAAELRILYSHAQALVFPSLYEGFGYSPLEAMCCHTPAIVSDIAAHRWVCGDAALYCNPYQVESLVEQLERLVFAGNDALKSGLVSRGLKRVQCYSPATVVDEWLALFERLSPQSVGMARSRRDGQRAAGRFFPQVFPDPGRAAAA